MPLFDFSFTEMDKSLTLTFQNQRLSNEILEEQMKKLNKDFGVKKLNVKDKYMEETSIFKHLLEISSQFSLFFLLDEFTYTYDRPIPCEDFKKILVNVKEGEKNEAILKLNKLVFPIVKIEGSQEEEYKKLVAEFNSRSGDSKSTPIQVECHFKKQGSFIKEFKKSHEQLSDIDFDEIPESKIVEIVSDKLEQFASVLEYSEKTKSSVGTLLLWALSQQYWHVFIGYLLLQYKKKPTVEMAKFIEDFVGTYKEEEIVKKRSKSIGGLFDGIWRTLSGPLPPSKESNIGVGIDSRSQSAGKKPLERSNGSFFAKIFKKNSITKENINLEIKQKETLVKEELKIKPKIGEVNYFDDLESKVIKLLKHSMKAYQEKPTILSPRGNVIKKMKDFCFNAQAVDIALPYDFMKVFNIVNIRSSLGGMKAVHSSNRNSVDGVRNHNKHLEKDSLK